MKRFSNRTYKVLRLTLIFALGILFFIGMNLTAHASNLTFIVDSNGDADDANVGDSICATAGGACTLRAAIQEANAISGIDTIQFNIPVNNQGDVPTITPDSPLPAIDDGIIINARTQPDSNMVELSGVNAGDDGNTANGLLFTAGAATVKGLVINRFAGSGIRLNHTCCVDIYGNRIGTDPTGTMVEPNQGFGIYVFYSSHLNIGGPNANQRNIISGNEGAGIELFGDDSDNNTIQGNYIGTDVTGTVALGNAQGGIANHNPGIDISGGDNNQIGGTATGEGNLISGNNDNGILIAGENTFNETDNNVVEGNLIGTDVTGNQPLGNGGSGVFLGYSTNNNIIGGDAPGAGNVIADNGSGIIVGDLPTSEFENPYPNGPAGNIIQGNKIGTNADGTQAMGNGGQGILVRLATDTKIGGTTAGARNIISGNDGDGILVQYKTTLGIPRFARNTTIQGNYIGLGADGSTALANQGSGIYDTGALDTTIGGTDPGAGNVISAARDRGIYLSGQYDTMNPDYRMDGVIQGNKIGTDAGGTLDRGNTQDGIFICGRSNFTIGGPNAGNVIAFNGHNGVLVGAACTTPVGNPIRQNSIFSNGNLGIDLNNDGVTPNDAGDADSGADNDQNYPELDTATVSSGSLHVAGNLHSAASASYTVDFFANTACDPSGNGEGQEFLGSTDVTTDENGDAPLNFSANVTTNPDDVTATATDSDGNTSEFSACKNVDINNNTASQYDAYSITPDNVNAGSVNAINNHTRLVYTADNNGYIWQNFVPIELGTFENGQLPAIPWGVNDSGDVVGQVPNETGQAHAFIWSDGAMTDLGTLSQDDQYSSSVAYGVNQDDVVVGYERHTNSNFDQLGGAVKWVNGGATLLPHAPGCARFCGSDIAHAINASGQIVGSASVDDYGPPFGYCCDHAALWDGNSLTMLDTEFNTDSVASSINNKGQSVGYKRYFLQGYATVPMLWNGAGGGTSLLSNGFDDGYAAAINNEGVVVGQGHDYDGNAGSGAFIWTAATGMVDLNSLIDHNSGWVLYDARGINDNGEIIGSGSKGNYLLRPSNLGNLSRAPYVVNSTDDAGDSNIGDQFCATSNNECTLRAAIQEANADSDTSKIVFAIPGGGIPTIAPGSALPEITAPVVLDAGTQPGCDTPPCVELAGNNAGDNDDGLVISAGNSEVRGLIINRFSSGITLKTKGNNKVQGNYIGTDQTGTARKANHYLGILIQNSSNNMIGGTHADERNVISGNGVNNGCDGNVTLIAEALGQSGISIHGTTSDGNIVQGNYIGTDKTGTVPLYNSCLGIGIGLGASGNIIGGNTAEARNIISGNSHAEGGAHYGWGIYLADLDSSGTVGNNIIGNYIGTDVNGTVALENDKGIVTVGGQNTIGGSGQGAGNVVSGNREEGILIQGVSAGTPNNTPGIHIQGNLIGVDMTGTVALGNDVGIRFGNEPNLLIGGTSQGARNVIAGNSAYGIIGTVDSATGIKIQGNAIGTDAGGTLDLGNALDGIFIANGTTAVVSIGGKQTNAGNLIAHNGHNGVTSTTTLTGTPLTTIRGNSIMNNAQEGIVVQPDGAIPTVKSSQYSNSRMKVKGTLNGDPNKAYNLDFYANAACDTGDFGEGQTYLGSKDVTTDAAGNATYQFTTNNVPEGTVVTATATGNGQTTGSFSRCHNMTPAAQVAYTAVSGDCDGNTPCYNSINDAIEAADPDGTVNVGPGTYEGDIVLDADVNLNMGDASGGGGGGGFNSVSKAGRKPKRAQAAMDAGDFVVNGSLSILNGNFQAPNTNLFVSGDLTLQAPGNFNNNSGTVVLDGIGTQHINGGFEFNSLTVNDGVTADGQDSATRVDGTFTNQGVAQNFQIQNVNNPDSFKSFQDLAGNVSAKLQTTGSPDLGNMTVKTYLNQTPQTACGDDTALSMFQRWFELERQDGNQAGVGAVVRFYYQDGDLNGADPDQLQIYHCNPTTRHWEALTTTQGSDGSGSYLQAQDVDTFSPFGMGSGTPTAPTSKVVSKFTGKGNTTPGVHLKWRTDNELQVAGFNILRSENGGDFAAVNSQLIAGKNPGGISATDYAYDDLTVTAGTTYAYRLETVLTNNTSLQTEPITVKVPNAGCAKPDAVTLVTPTDGATVKPKGLLDWSDATCAKTYQVMVRRAGKQHSQIVNEKKLTVSQYAFQKFKKGKYEWRVRACDAKGCGAWSAWSGFVVVANAKKGK